MEEKHLKAIEKQLDDVCFYSPTIPLGWNAYHDIIEKLIAEIRRLKQVHGHGDGI